MKLFKSIKWRLQIWYGLILVIVLAGFGFTAYQLERNRQFRRIDEELHKRIGVIGNALHRPRGGPNAGGQPFYRPPHGQFPEDGPPDQDQRPPMAMGFQLREQDEHFFDPNDPNQFYFSITTRAGQELAHSTNQPAHPIASLTDADIAENGISPKPPGKRRLSSVFTEGSFCEVAEILPSGEVIRIGCTITPELKELERTQFNLVAIGGVILFVGLAGGWRLVSQSLKPISGISATAVKISAGDLSQRINSAEAESELGQLAAVLNSTFARLETAFAQQKQFASDAAHELRTPVSVILTQTQTALNRERDAAGYKQAVEACQRAAQRMRKLIELLLELARFDAGQEVLNRRRFDFSKTISECAELVQPLADARGVEIISKLSPLEIAGDSERLAQVVTNLLTNAIQYNRRGGEVRVSLESQNGLAVLAIADTGPGITPEDLPRVFERFYRGDKARAGAGAGLGLSISKAIVEAHGGTIEAASEAGAGGSTFTLRLPVNA